MPARLKRGAGYPLAILAILEVCQNKLHIFFNLFENFRVIKILICLLILLIYCAVLEFIKRFVINFYYQGLNWNMFCFFVSFLFRVQKCGPIPPFCGPIPPFCGPIPPFLLCYREQKGLLFTELCPLFHLQIWRLLVALVPQ